MYYEKVIYGEEGTCEESNIGVVCGVSEEGNIGVTKINVTMFTILFSIGFCSCCSYNDIFLYVFFLFVW